jgi:hypothetical protein
MSENAVFDSSDVSDALIDDLLRNDSDARSMATHSPAVKLRTRDDVAADFKELLESSRTQSSFVENEALRRRLEREQRESELSKRESELLQAVTEEETTYAAELRTLDEELARQREAERVERQTILQVLLLLSRLDLTNRLC